jgi:hypothetical protein
MHNSPALKYEERNVCIVRPEYNEFRQRDKEKKGVFQDMRGLNIKRGFISKIQLEA